LYYCQPYHNPTSVEHLGLDCKVEYTNSNQGIIPDAHNIGVQHKQSEENDLDNTVQGLISSFPVSYFSWTPLNQILQFQKRFPASNAISMFSKRCSTTAQWVLRPQAQEYALVIPTMFQDIHGWADCVEVFIWGVKPMNKMRIVIVGGIIRPAHLVQEDLLSGGIDSVWCVNNHVDFDLYWTVY
jgi:hypothetical protein